MSIIDMASVSTVLTVTLGMLTAPGQTPVAVGAEKDDVRNNGLGCFSEPRI